MGRGSRLPPSPCGSPGLDDPYQHGRGVALGDFNRDGRVDIVYGNWNGPHRLYLQSGGPGRVRFRVRAGARTPPPPTLLLSLWSGGSWLHPDLALSPNSQRGGDPKHKSGTQCPPPCAPCHPVPIPRTGHRHPQVLHAVPCPHRHRG